MFALEGYDTQWQQIRVHVCILSGVDRVLMVCCKYIKESIKAIPQ